MEMKRITKSKKLLRFELFDLFCQNEKKFSKKQLLEISEYIKEKYLNKNDPK